MQLNEHAGRIDNQIEKVCSKFEKMAFDNGATELLYHDEQNDKQSKLTILPIYIFISQVQRLHLQLLMECAQVQLKAATSRANKRFHDCKYLFKRHLNRLLRNKKLWSRKTLMSLRQPSLSLQRFRGKKVKTWTCVTSRMTFTKIVSCPRVISAKDLAPKSGLTFWSSSTNSNSQSSNRSSSHSWASITRLSTQTKRNVSRRSLSSATMRSKSKEVRHGKTSWSIMNWIPMLKTLRSKRSLLVRIFLLLILNKSKRIGWTM